MRRVRSDRERLACATNARQQRLFSIDGLYRSDEGCGARGAPLSARRHVLRCTRKKRGAACRERAQKPKKTSRVFSARAMGMDGIVVAVRSLGCINRCRNQK